MIFSETIRIPATTELAALSLAVRQLLTELGFELVSCSEKEIQAVKASPLGATDFRLRVSFSADEVVLHAGSRPRRAFVALLPLTGCSLLCSISCGIACAVACSCGASTFFLGHAVAGLRAYSRHLFHLIAVVIREKARHGQACQGCGTPVPVGAKFCRNCGVQIS